MTHFARNADAVSSEEVPNDSLNCSVVVAEDETMIRLDMAEILTEAGATVLGTASNGREAIDLIVEHNPDLVILDVKMPDMDGLEVAEHIGAQCDAAVVMVTAFSDPTFVQRAASAGALGYVVKPFTASNLLPAVRVALARHAQLSETRGELEGVTQKLADRKLLDRAKGLLNQKFGLSEPEAFRWIQKESMDQRLTMSHVAERIIEELSPGGSGSADSGKAGAAAEAGGASANGNGAAGTDAAADGAASAGADSVGSEPGGESSSHTG